MKKVCAYCLFILIISCSTQVKQGEGQVDPLQPCFILSGEVYTLSNKAEQTLLRILERPPVVRKLASPEGRVNAYFEIRGCRYEFTPTSIRTRAVEQVVEWQDKVFDEMYREISYNNGHWEIGNAMQALEKDIDK